MSNMHIQLKTEEETTYVPSKQQQRAEKYPLLKIFYYKVLKQQVKSKVIVL